MELHFWRSKGIAAFQQEFAHGINITSEVLEANRAFIVCEFFDSPAFDDDDKGIRPMLYVLAPKRTFFFSLCPEDCLPAKPMLKRGENMRLYKIIKKAMRIVSSCKRETILDTLRRHYLEFCEGYWEPGEMGYHQSMLNLFEEIKVQFMHARGANSALTINQDIDETRRSKAFCNFIMQADYPVAKKDLPNTFQVMTQQMINNNMYLDIVFLNDIVDFTPYTLVTLEILLEKSAYCFHLLDKNRLERLRAC